jgi:hypothetical protein
MTTWDRDPFVSHLFVADAALGAMGLPMPEPSTWAMLLISFVSFGFAEYRRGAWRRLL